MCLLMLWLVAITEEPSPAEEPSLEADLSYEDLRCEDDCGPNGRQSSYFQFCAGVLHECRQVLPWCYPGDTLVIPQISELNVFDPPKGD